MSEERKIIYLLDEEEAQRANLRNSLRHLFSDAFEIQELPVIPTMTEYLSILDAPEVAAVFVDQHLDQTGEITDFTGVQLSEMLRTHFQEMPIYVVTGHAIEGELTSEESGSTDAVVSKSALVIGDSRSLAFKQQFLRRIGQYNRALTERQTRFRELLSKRLKGKISLLEEAELSKLEMDRQMPAASAESEASKRIQGEIEVLNGLLSRVESLMKSK